MKNKEEFSRHYNERDIGAVSLGDDVYLLDMMTDEWLECQLFKIEINKNGSEIKRGDFGVIGEILYTGQAKYDDREIKGVECLSQKHYNAAIVRYLRYVRSVKLFNGEVN